jgi:hypothetical protein
LTGESNVANSTMPMSIRQLTADDVVLMEALLETFADAFDEVEMHRAKRPDARISVGCWAASISLHWRRRRRARWSAASQPTN